MASQHRFSQIDEILFSGHFFAVTGFEHDDSVRIVEEITSRGGSYDSSTGLDLADYLIVRDHAGTPTNKYYKALELLETGCDIRIISNAQYDFYRNKVEALTPEELSVAAEHIQCRRAERKQAKALRSAARRDAELQKKQKEKATLSRKAQLERSFLKEQMDAKRMEGKLGSLFQFTQTERILFSGSTFFLYGFSQQAFLDLRMLIMERGGKVCTEFLDSINYVVLNEFASVRSSDEEKQLISLNHDPDSGSLICWLRKNQFTPMLQREPVVLTRTEIMLLYPELQRNTSTVSMNAAPLLPPPSCQEGSYLVDVIDQLDYQDHVFTLSGVSAEDQELIAPYIEERGGLVRRGLAGHVTDYVIDTSFLPVTNTYLEVLEARKTGSGIRIISLDRLFRLTGLYRQRSPKERILTQDGLEAKRKLSELYESTSDSDSMLLLNSMTSEDLLSAAMDAGLMETALRSNAGDSPYAFVSYSHKNIGMVKTILRRLQKDGYHFWYDEGITPGKDWDDVLYERITGAGIFLAFLSDDYLSSDNCKDELSLAIEESSIVPILLDDAAIPPDFSYLNTCPIVATHGVPDDMFFRQLYLCPGMSEIHE